MGAAENYDAARAQLFEKMKIGAKLQNADGSRWILRALLPDDDRAVIRRWYPSMRRYHYEVISPVEVLVGLFVVTKKRRGT
jgi:hypothetical protein